MVALKQQEERRFLLGLNAEVSTPRKLMNKNELLNTMLLSILAINSESCASSIWDESAMNLLRQGLKPRPLNPYEPFGVYPSFYFRSHKRGGW